MSYTFVLIHGAFHTPKVWEPLSERLTKGDHNTVIAPDLPTTDVTGTFAKEAEIVADQAEGYDNIFLVAHSRGVEVVPRYLAKADLDKVVGAVILNSGGPYGIEPVPEYDEEPYLERHTPAYQSAIELREDGLAEFDKSRSKELFYNCVEQEDVWRPVADELRLQRPNLDFSAPPALPPNFPIYYFLGKHDRVLNNERAHRVAVQWLGERAVRKPLPADHTPQLSIPDLLSGMVLELAQLSYQQRALSRT